VNPVYLPIFPLPDLTFFPHTLLPLHIFEARYRAMITDCLARDRRLAVVGLIGFAIAFGFTLITLPVEIGASGRALAFVEGLGMTGERQDGARAVLKAAAWTYVAAALTAMLTFLYYLSLVMGRRD